MHKRISIAALVAVATTAAVAAAVTLGPSSVTAVVDAWMNSPGHCRNIMSPLYRDIGVACASNANSTYRRYWTMELGAH